ncbi:MAG: isoprenyl transferase [Acidobacteriota bacterium]
MIDLEELAEKGSEEENILRTIDFAHLPRHVAIIMDGNGRWARMRNLPRVSGHRAGIESVRDTIEAAAKLGLEIITLYAFSIENFKRPRAEIDTLMSLLKEYVHKEKETLIKNNIRFKAMGRLHLLGEEIEDILQEVEKDTEKNSGLLFNIALGYSGRAEIVDAVKKIVKDGKAGRIDERLLDERSFACYLYTAGLTDPDLLIRTSGELRVSNFLLWQIAYSEIWVTETLWPDFRRKELFQAIADYQKRERRYGGIEENHREEKDTGVLTKK